MHRKAQEPTASTDCSALDSIEAAKAKQSSLRERLAARRQLLASVTHPTKNLTSSSLLLTGNSGVGSFNKSFGVNSSATSLFGNAFKKKRVDSNPTDVSQTVSTNAQSNMSSVSGLSSSPPNCCPSENSSHNKLNTKFCTDDLQKIDIPTDLPDESTSSGMENSSNRQFSEQSKDRSQHSLDLCSERKPVALVQKNDSSKTAGTKQLQDESTQEKNKSTVNKVNPAGQKEGSQRIELELENLLGAETTREKESKRIREEVMELLNRQSTKERFLTERFRTQGGSQVQQFCSHGTRIECSKVKARTGDREKCTKLHFRKIIHPHTDESLGDCSFLNTCFHVDTCKYVHYTIDYSDSVTASRTTNRNSLNNEQRDNCTTTTSNSNSDTGKTQTTSNTLDSTATTKENGAPLILYPPQWINCDIRLINMSILGKFSVIMADPHDEMRRLDIPCLQDDGYIFLWVTGRAMELGRECLRLWGYERIDEIIWVKTNQLQRLIRTGRTGHWLNHGKEHCLVGVKGNPKGVNRGLDCDIIVSEVRETSHKPDEIYGIIERLSPGTRKLELFGRPHNLQPNWITLGNQLDGTYLVDPAVVERFKKQYPNGLDEKAK
ncbi:unnamed protein product [Heterobilharzia americana]|nr:unnamed protein product [Heterobilharzia americana]